MAYEPEGKFTLRTGSVTGAEARAVPIDAGLREYMLRIYNYMASGLALTGIVAYFPIETALKGFSQVRILAQ